MQKIINQKKAVQAELLTQLIRAKNMMEEDLSRKVNIAALAKEATLSKFYFLRCFKNAFGLSPHQYILNKRLERSMELLNEGKWMVTDIAYLVGFNDIYSFSKSFKKHFNACPSHFSVSAKIMLPSIIFC